MENEIVKVRLQILNIILSLIYLLCIFRYLPDRPMASMVQTATHLLTVAPFLIGALLLFNSFYKKQAGDKPAPSKLIRVGLTLGIVIEFFIGLFNYLVANQTG